MIRAVFFIASAAGLALIPSIACAQVDTNASAVVTASTGYSSNPFAGNGGESGFAELRINPTVRLRTEQDTLSLIADAQLQQYFRRYGLRDNYDARMNYSRRQSDRLTLTANAGYFNAISGSSFTGAVIPDQVDPVPPVIADDVGFFGSGNRRETVNVQAGATLLWSPVDQINFYGSGVSTSNSRRGQAINYSGYGGGLGYSRQLNETTKIGVRGSVNKTDYVGSAETTVYSIEGTFDGRVNDRWTVTGSLGVSRLDSDARSVVIGGLSSRTTVSGSVALCSRTPTGELCLGANRAILPSSFGGARVQSTIDVSYRAKLSEHDSITARSAYTRVNGSGGGILSSFRYWANSVGYTRKLGERLGLTANALYRTVNGGPTRRNDDVGGNVGLAYTLGNMR